MSEFLQRINELLVWELTLSTETVCVRWVKDIILRASISILGAHMNDNAKLVKGWFSWASIYPNLLIYERPVKLPSLSQHFAAMQTSKIQAL